jgi:hypothetical protein
MSRWDDPQIAHGILEIIRDEARAEAKKLVPVKRYGVLVSVSADRIATVRFANSPELSTGWPLSGETPAIGARVRCWEWPGDDGDRYVEGTVGADAGPAPFVGCRATISTAVSLANDTDVDVLFDVEAVDRPPMHDISIYPDRFTIPAGQDGVWLVVGSAQFLANATGRRRAVISIDGTMVDGSNNMAAPTGDHRIQCAYLGPLVAGQIVRLSVRQASGGALNLIAASMAMIRLAA